jgi:hypothetical protein
MAKWLQEPEYQRMSALRLAGEKRSHEQSHQVCVVCHLIAAKKGEHTHQTYTQGSDPFLLFRFMLILEFKIFIFCPYSGANSPTRK